MAVVISSTGIVQAVVPLTTSNTVVAPLSGIAGQLPLRHNQLVSRGAEDAHPMSAITGLEEALDLAASDISYEPSVGEDWDPGATPILPGDVAEALDVLAQRGSDFSGDAGDVPYTPDTPENWDDGDATPALPGDVGEALDILAAREGGVSSASEVSYEPANEPDWDDGTATPVIPANVAEALDRLVAGGLGGSNGSSGGLNVEHVKYLVRPTMPSVGMLWDSNIFEVGEKILARVSDDPEEEAEWGIYEATGTDTPVYVSDLAGIDVIVGLVVFHGFSDIWDAGTTGYIFYPSTESYTEGSTIPRETVPFLASLMPPRSAPVPLAAFAMFTDFLFGSIFSGMAGWSAFLDPFAQEVAPAGPLQGDNGGAGFTLLESAMLPDMVQIDGGPPLQSVHCYWIEVELRCLDAGAGRPVVKLTFESENEIPLTGGVWEKVTRYNDSVDYWIGGPGAEGDQVVYVGLDSGKDPEEQVGFLPESGTVVFRFSLDEYPGEYIQDPRCLIETSNLDGSGELVEVSRIRAGLRANYQL